MTPGPACSLSLRFRPLRSARANWAEEKPRAGDVGRQRQIVDAFFEAARDGDFEALIAVLHPDVVLRIDGGAAFLAASMLVRGAADVAKQSGSGMKSLLRRADTVVHPTVVNDSAGVIVTMADKAMSVMGFTFSDGRIVEIDSISDPERVAGIIRAWAP